MSESNEKISLTEDDAFWNDMGVSTSTTTPISIPETKSVSKESPIKSIEPTLETIPEDTGHIKNVRFTPNDLPTIRSDVPVPPEYQSVVDNVLYGYSTLPKLAYNKLYHELNNELSLKSEETPDPQSINQALDRIQAAKDRLEKIMEDAVRCYNFKKRMVDMLEVAWNKYSSAKSADTRKSEAAVLISDFNIDLGYVEGLWKSCDVKLRNLESQHDTVSRKITTMQVCLKYFDLARGSSPDFSFKSFSDKLNDKENQDKIIIDPNQSINAEEHDFAGK